MPERERPNYPNEWGNAYLWQDGKVILYRSVYTSGTFFAYGVYDYHMVQDPKVFL